MKEYINPPHAVLEMLKGSGQFPIPTTILFQHRIVKSITPQLTHEMQLLWDPDYLLQIAIQHPVVISKKPEGVFFIHSQSFSASSLQRISESESKLKRFALAMDSLSIRLKTNPYIKERDRKNIYNLIDAMEKNFLLANTGINFLNINTSLIYDICKIKTKGTNIKGVSTRFKIYLKLIHLIQHYPLMRYPIAITHLFYKKLNRLRTFCFGKKEIPIPGYEWEERIQRWLEQYHQPNLGCFNKVLRNIF